MGLALTKEEVNFLCRIVGSMYREGGSASPRPAGWTREEWELRKKLYGKLMVANRTIRPDWLYDKA